MQYYYLDSYFYCSYIFLILILDY